LGWLRCGGSKRVTIGSEILRNPISATVYDGEEISNFTMEMSVIMEEIKWGKGEGEAFFPTLPAFIITNFSWLAEE
jgi:hypothetical protein